MLLPVYRNTARNKATDFFLRQEFWIYLYLTFRFCTQKIKCEMTLNFHYRNLFINSLCSNGITFAFSIFKSLFLPIKLLLYQKCHWRKIRVFYTFPYCFGKNCSFSRSELQCFKGYLIKTHKSSVNFFLNTKSRF